MSGRKKKFPCGHSGRGQYCHRCREEELERQVETENRLRRGQAKLEWETKLADSPVSLTDIPRHVAEKALEVIADLRKPPAQRRFTGRRLTTIGQRDIVRFEIGWSYRLICRENGDGLQFLEVISHETYNTRLASGGWR